MIGLAAAVARAELRPGQLAVITAAGGGLTAVLSVVTDPRTPAGPYAVATESAYGLRYSGFLLVAVSAWMQIRPAENGVARELFLAGVSSPRRRRATAVAAILTCVALWVGMSVVALLVAGTWAGGVDMASAKTATSAVVVAVGSAIMLSLVGSACGSLASSRVGGTAVVTALAALPLALALVGRYPPALILKSLFPAETVPAMLAPFEGIRGEPAFRWGVPLVWLSVSAALVARRTAGGDVGVVRWRGAERPRRLDVLPLVLLGLSVVVLGAVVPARVARTIPWWLQGRWLSDLATGSDSKPVAEAYVQAVIDGDAATERRLLAQRGEPIDPQLRRNVQRAGRVADVEYSYVEGSLPGTVTFGFRRDPELQLVVCVVRSASGWSVVRTRTVWTC